MEQAPTASVRCGFTFKENSCRMTLLWKLAVRVWDEMMANVQLLTFFFYLDKMTKWVLSAWLHCKQTDQLFFCCISDSGAAHISFAGHRCWCTCHFKHDRVTSSIKTPVTLIIVQTEDHQQHLTLERTLNNLLLFLRSLWRQHGWAGFEILCLKTHFCVISVISTPGVLSH